jgi:LmbE family N-acetylglucosaminyl deacetylase
MQPLAPIAPFPENWERALCVVAHPDDLEYGAASAIARWTSQGKTVTYLLATRGEAGIDGMRPEEAAPLREQEERNGAAEVGVKTVDFLDHQDGIVEYGLPLRRDITRAIRKYRPEVIISGAFDVKMFGMMSNQADHRTVGLAALDAARDAGNRWIFTELLEEGLEPWGGVRLVAYGGTDKATHGVDVTGEHLQRGIKSLDAHAAYTAGLGDRATGLVPSEFLTWVAQAAGPALGVEAAVLFEVYTLIPDAPPPWMTGDRPA